MFRLAHPWALAFLLLLPLARYLRRRGGPGRGALRFSAVEAARQAGGGRRRRLASLPEVLRTLAVVLVVVALARPQTGLASRDVHTRGIDIVMAMDVSSSMLAEDLEPNRLEAAKVVAADFVAGRPDDRIGLVAFAAQAFTQVPLTLDHSVVEELLGSLEVGMIEDGTAVGMGLATAVKRLEASDAASKVVILLTDGRNNRGEIGPVTAARTAQALGVRVYTIGVGTRGIARVPVQDPLTGRTRYATTRVDVDEPTLQEVARVTGGQYFRATDNESLAAIYEEIDQLETTEMEVRNYTRYEERFAIPLGAAVLIMVAELVLGATVLRRLP